MVIYSNGTFDQIKAMTFLCDNQFIDYRPVNQTIYIEEVSFMGMYCVKKRQELVCMESFLLMYDKPDVQSKNDKSNV